MRAIPAIRAGATFRRAGPDYVGGMLKQAQNRKLTEGQPLVPTRD